MDVCLVESGGFTPDEDTQSLYDLQSTGYPVRENFMSRARYFGGSCNLWAGRNMTLNAIDFEARDWVPDSGWPIPHAEVARYYPRTFEILELPTPGPCDARSSWLSGCRRTNASCSRAGRSRRRVSLWPRSATRFGSAFGSTLRKAPNVRVLLNASVTRMALERQRGVPSRP